MAILNVTTYSESLEFNINFTAIVPDKIKDPSKINVLFLLHGYSGHHGDYLNNTAIARYAAEYNIAVIMPSINNSYYANMKHGLNYFDFITKDLPNITKNIFNLEVNQNNTYIAGLSMGGYGALKAAFTFPKNYRGAASMSGALEINTMIKSNRQPKLLDGVFGLERIVQPENDLFELSVKNDISNLNLLITCGTEDFLYQDNLKFKGHLDAHKIYPKYVFSEGNHNWDYWDAHLKIILKHFFE